MGVEVDFAVAATPREPDAFSDQPAAEAQPAGLRLDQEEAQPGHPVGLLDQADGADGLAVALGDPATLALGVELADELRDDLGDQRLEALVEPVLLRVEDAVTVDDPAHVA